MSDCCALGLTCGSLRRQACKANETPLGITLGKGTLYELPKVTPHVCRRKFCSKMARNGVNPAKLKYIMGHADIDVTYNIYTHMGARTFARIC